MQDEELRGKSLFFLFLVNIFIYEKKIECAPVDTMGCSKLSEELDEKTKRYQTLISLMLSSQTKDTMTAKAMEKLRKHGLTVKEILDTEEEKISELIHGVSFHKRKATYIKKASKILKDQYDCDIPPTLKEVVKLPGVGPKMGHLLMTHAWGKTEGIGVDVHVHRISNRLNWVKSKTPEETRVQLEKWLPRELWVCLSHSFFLAVF